MTELKMSPEVLIYIQNIKKYLESHDDMREYFELDKNEDIFFEYVKETSQSNFKDNGNPEITLEQYEEIKKKLSEFTKKDNEVKGIFINIGTFGLISLN